MIWARYAATSWIAAALAEQQMEAATRERLRRTCAAEMNYRGQLLLPPRANGGSSPMPEDLRDVAVQKDRSKLNGVTWHDPRTEAIGRAAILNDGMVENAITLRLREGRVGHLVHADAA